jgi:hypothetical protein
MSTASGVTDNGLSLSKVDGHKAKHREGHEITFNVHIFQSAEATSETKEKQIKNINGLRLFRV